MTSLQNELRRLYLVDDANNSDPDGGAPGWMTADGRTRAMVLELARPADWPMMSTVWQGVQADLALPAPAIAVSGTDGFQLWFSLAEAVPVAQAQAFLESLCLRYLVAIAPVRMGLMPSATRCVPLVPAEQPGTGLWSAFVAPDLAPIFADSPWLDVCPSPEAQAHVLTRLTSIKPDAFHDAMNLLGSSNSLTRQTREIHAEVAPAPQANGLNARQFLHNVMNDPAIALPLRIEAAKALLPYA